MIKLLKHLIFLILLQGGFSANAQSSAESIPKNGWEHWVQSIKEGGIHGLPGRPDGSTLDSKLPLWVDCHLSWYLDQPQSKKNPLFQKVVLRSTRKLCKGQLEEWAP